MELRVIEEGCDLRLLCRGLRYLVDGPRDLAWAAAAPPLLRAGAAPQDAHDGRPWREAIWYDISQLHMHSSCACNPLCRLLCAL